MLLRHDSSSKDNDVWAEGNRRIHCCLCDVVGLNIPYIAVQFNVFPTNTCTSFKTWTSRKTFQTAVVERTNTLEFFFHIHWVLGHIVVSHFWVPSSPDKLTTLDDTSSDSCSDCIVNQVFDMATRVIACDHFSIGRAIHICREIDWYIQGTTESPNDIYIGPIWFWSRCDETISV